MVFCLVCILLLNKKLFFLLLLSYYLWVNNRNFLTFILLLQLSFITIFFTFYCKYSHIDDPDSTSVLLSTILGGLSMLAKETGITVLLINLMFDVYKSWPSLKRTILDVRWSEETYQFARRFSRVLLSMGVLLAIRLALLQGSLPRFSQQDNPAAFHPNIYVR